jgi:hypothetical protein
MAEEVAVLLVALDSCSMDAHSHWSMDMLAPDNAHYYSSP